MLLRGPEDLDRCAENRCVTASFFTLEPGTPVVDRFGRPVGRVARVLVAYGEYFDGVVVATAEGDRFVDAPEVRRIGDDEVELTVTLFDVLHPGPKGPPGPPDVHTIRLGRVEATEADRTVAMDQLKLAFVEDQLSIEELERRVELAHRATGLEELDQLVPDGG